MSNHRYLFEEVQRAVKTPKVYICTGDFWQIFPVIQNGRPEDIMGATISSSIHWGDFEIIRLTENMRLTALSTNLTNMTPVEIEHAQRQFEYNAMLEAVAKNASINHCHCISKVDEHTKIVALPVSYILDTNIDEAVNFLYPGSIFDSNLATANVVLSTTNDGVDKWNEKIQALYPNPLQTLKSHDIFADVDDPKGILQRNLTEAVLNDFNRTTVPPHSLKLKVGDICIIVRSMMSHNI